MMPPIADPRRRPGTRRRRRIASVFAALACAAAPGLARAAGHLPEGVLESSGLVASRAHPGVFWTHSDSGDVPRIFAVRADGSLVREVAVQGASAVDWEDIATDDAGNLWIADCGNNKNKRRDLVVYRVPEPSPDGAAGAVVDLAVHFRFPDQDAFPDPARKNFDAEALVFARGELLLLTKHRSDTRSTLYRFPRLEPAPLDAPVTLERISDIDVGGAGREFGGRVTGADATPDGARLAVLTYHAILLFDRPPEGDDYLASPPKVIGLDALAAKQCEGIAWDGEALVFTNEEREVHRIANPADPACATWPSPGCR
jgi:hypothetical protein